MADRTELLESALDSLAEGVALADHEGCVALWNRSAEIITGFASGEIVGRGVRAILDALVVGGAQHWVSQTDGEKDSGRGALVQVRHKIGHEVPLMARVAGAARRPWCADRDGSGVSSGGGSRRTASW